MIVPRFVCGVVMAACLLRGSDARAQQPTTGTAQDTTPVITTEPQWEIELHGGLSADRDASGGTSALPVTGSTVQGLVSLSTIFFGAGTTLFNQAQPSSPMTALDPALTSPAITRGTGAVFGGRVFRAITGRFGVEFGGDYAAGQLKFRTSTLGALEASRVSFVRAVGGALPGGTVNAATTVTDNEPAARMLATGALVVNARTTGRTTPYLVLGGGVVFNNGSAPEATLTGTYQVGTPSTLYGTDTVRLTYAQDDHSVVYLVGGGLKQQVSRHFGARVDARVHLYKSSLINLVDVSPQMQTVTVGQPAPIITRGGLQFSSIGPLNGPSYAGAETFITTGLQAHFAFTAGLFLRF